MRLRLLASVVVAVFLSHHVTGHDLASSVNMYVGTSFSFNISDVHDYGNAMLSVGSPHAHTSWTPQTRSTENKCESPYYYFDAYWRGLRRTHWMSGSCVIDYGSASILPTYKLSMKESLQLYRLNHSNEAVKPHLYSVSLPESSLYLEATSKDAAGILRISRPILLNSSNKLYVLFMGSDTMYNHSSVEIVSNDTVLVSSPIHRWYQGKGESAGFSGHHYFKASRQAETFGIIYGQDEEVKKGATTGISGSAGIAAAYLQFDISDGPVTIATGASFLSTMKAEENMRAELIVSPPSASKSGGSTTSTRGYMRGRASASMDEVTLFDLDRLAKDVKEQWNKKLESISINLGDRDADVGMVHDIPVQAGLDHDRRFQRSPSASVESIAEKGSLTSTEKLAPDVTDNFSAASKNNADAISTSAVHGLNSIDGAPHDFSDPPSSDSPKQYFSNLQTVFYSALWHALLLPRVVSDHDGAYLSFGFDSKFNTTDDESEVQRVVKYSHDASNAIQFRRYYDDFSMWDTFRAQMPLLLLISEKSDIRDMIASLVVKSQQGGWLPIFPAWNSYTAEMIGDHCSVFIADAIFKGVLSKDDPLIEPAADAIVRNALTQAPEKEYKQGKGRRAMESYLRLGYIPIEDEILDSPHPRQQVSRSLEYYYDDFVVGQLVAFLSSTHGKYRCLQSLAVSLQLGAAAHLSEASVSANLDESCIEVAETLLRRSRNYHHAIDGAGTGFIRPKHENGSWALNETEFDPTGYFPWITETTAWQYTWFVPHDVEGMIKLYGGEAKFFAKLDQFFDERWYNHGNEPDHHALYLYAFLEGGAPTLQRRLVDIVRSQYGPTEKGLPGNEDAGQMSAWLVMSALGLYPVCPGCGGHSEYALGAPLFDNVTLHLAPAAYPSSSGISSSSNSTSTDTAMPHHSHPIAQEYHRTHDGNSGTGEDAAPETPQVGKTLKILVAGREQPLRDVYVQQLFINGKEYDCGFVSHETVMNGGVWTYVMGAVANATRAKSGRACLHS